VRIVVAPDKFKGTFTAAQAAAAIACGVQRAQPKAEIIEVPVGDGGDGTLDALLANGWSRHEMSTVSALGEPVRVSWASRDETAYVELSAASGWRNTPPSAATASRASTYGTGLVVGAAIDAGFSHVQIGLGGSATTDGGLGLLRALGALAIDREGIPLREGGGALSDLGTIRLHGVGAPVRNARISAVCDVRVPLLGPGGAARFFGPQKGADPSLVAKLEYGLDNFAAVLAGTTGRDPRLTDWAGAAGGTAGGLYAALGADVVLGSDFILEAVQLSKLLADADLVIVGEGSMDEQSLKGKAPVGVARAAAALGVPVIAIVGRLSVSPELLQEQGIALAVEAAPGTLRHATAADLEHAANDVLASRR